MKIRTTFNTVSIILLLINTGLRHAIRSKIKKTVLTPNMLKTILRNLISNAVKFTFSGVQLNFKHPLKLVSKNNCRRTYPKNLGGN